MKYINHPSKCKNIKFSTYLITLFILLLSSAIAQAAPGDKKWAFATGDTIATCPAIGYDGTIYVGSYDGKLYALNTDGTKKWAFSTDDFLHSSPVIGCDGTIYVGSLDKKLYAINPDGTQKWAFTTGDMIYCTPAIDCNGTIYIGSHDNNLYAINPDGTQKWAFTATGSIMGSPAISHDGTFYFGSHDSNIYALNPNGTQKWAYTTGGMVRSSPAIGSDGTIYAGSADKNLYALNTDGTLKWKFTTGDDVRSSPAIACDGTIYVGSDDNNLYALNTDGTLKWKFTTGDDVRSSPAIGKDGTIYIGSFDKRLYALNPDGSQKWAFRASGFIGSSSPTIDSDGTVYVGSSDNNLYALEGDSGGLACSPWPKFHQNTKNSGRYIGYGVASSLTQDTGIIVGVSNCCEKAITLTELKKKYSFTGYANSYTVRSFNATINISGGHGTFVLNSTKIPSGRVSDFQLIKFYDSKGISRQSASYAASGPEYSVDGSWWITDSNGIHMAPNDTTTPGSEYFIYFVVKDNGIYDENDTLGVITDPVAVSISSCTGCTLNPNADFFIEWLFMGLVVVTLMLRKYFKQRG
ncbi:PQQ-binding-like beta-propeller repeat protein [Maridesulfovibrio zosterae]|uniref:outer membrane protein assembly factor BamB family protein n=1 Tax=Maridesulfovibrio zosterae TaxID=82171 RepID=UPI00040C0CF2|nr:PQQ-binding-like beta-propeller repeat protein [Maridesulfovibrio zosterae]